MKVIVTCGPGSEPIDQVRFISNFSTGELGMLLSKELQQHGFQVLCLRSKLATYPVSDGIETITFSTNDELAEILQRLSAEEDIAAIFHAAALCDYRVQKITTMNGAVCSLAKIPTNMGLLNITLEPSLKVIAKLRFWFSNALLIGWKYEVMGIPEEADEKAKQQIKKYQLDASVANGPATKGNFDVIFRDESRYILASKKLLAHSLAEWLRDTLQQTLS